MGATKRKEAPSAPALDSKKHKTNGSASTKSKVPVEKPDEDEFAAFSEEDERLPTHVGLKQKPNGQTQKSQNRSTTSSDPKQFKLETSSAEAHAKQRALAKERKLSKPNSDAIQRTKKIWERLRRKSHVPPAERKELVHELFTIITGHIEDFVFKHDSVRVVQCALKYANQEQRRQISQELVGSIRALVESRYGKFLVAKLVQDQDEQVRSAIIPEFYGHVRRLINHPEASWIVDDIYRQVATPKQKAAMLREWYGAEFALFHRTGRPTNATVTSDDNSTADLSSILEREPAKRKPILQYLLQMINGLVQKKMTGFTMLHDAMLQYFLAVPEGSSDRAEFLEILKGDIDPDTEGGGGDLFRNLSFTKSGSRLVCLALAYSGAKDRKIVLKCFRDTIEVMAFDQYAKMVLVVGLDVPDDTKMSSRSILFDLLGQGIEDETQKLDRLEQLTTNLHARVPLLYPFSGQMKWLLTDTDQAILNEVHRIREDTSKKAPAVRQQELVEYMAEPMLELITKRAENLVRTSFGCQFITEVLLGARSKNKSKALSALAQPTRGDPNEEGHVAQEPAVGRMLKTLVLGGNYDPSIKKARLVEPQLGFGAVLYAMVGNNVVEWACSDSSFVIVGFLESEDVPENVKAEIRAALKKGSNRIDAAANGHEGSKANAGAKLLLEKIG